jgi:phenylpropionate dioxygenase-like ring-hydroxylating dioxygenase large terminal subunit
VAILAEGDASKRAKELRDRRGYLKNVWYAAALSEKLAGNRPLAVELCGKQMVVWRDENTGLLHCIENACPHRGAPLSGGWVERKDDCSTVVCPYHGWSFDGGGYLHDVPAMQEKRKWPHRSLVEAYPVEEKGGFVWLFYGSKQFPKEARPPIPWTPELDEKKHWKTVYAEMEFECNHFGVFENAIDMAHIHYVHSDSFGNRDAPAIRDMEATSDAFSVTATFKIHHKPVNAFWALFEVPAVDVTAKAFLPSTSLVSFSLANGLSFITFVNTVPISATRSINRFALIRQLRWDKTGLFNANIWDGWARDAMIKILSEDRAMVEKLRYEELATEYSVHADLPQLAFRKLRQQWVDLMGVVPSETKESGYIL